MSNYTPEQFNEAMARLAGITIHSPDEDGGFIHTKTNTAFARYWNPCNDLNQLMPLAFWSNAIQSAFYCADEVGFEAWLRAIKDNLWQLAQEQQE